MSTRSVAIGHFGLLLGLLAVILELNQIAVESATIYGTADAAFYLALVVWAIAVLLVAAEWAGSDAPESPTSG